MRRALPQVEPDPTLPRSVTVYEVGPRDGLQNESTVVPVEVKAELVRRLVAAGLTTIETTSFADPRWVPQLADAEPLLTALGDVGRGPDRPVLVPNTRGLDRALTAGAGAVAIFGSATETFARRNLNRSVAESVRMFEPVVERALASGCWVRAYVSMCFGDPWEGPVPLPQVVDVCRRLMDLGCAQLSLGDTIGVGTTGHVHRLLEALDGVGIGPERVGVHFHDT
ncbi:MAG: hydroxymethylglutaryl-CoA lyase, partial [Phycicoccus sp.]